MSSRFLSLPDDTSLLDIAKRSLRGWIDDKAASMGAALSYYTVFSLAPTLLIAISVAGLVFGHEAAQGAIESQLRGLLGPTAAGAVQALLRNVSRPGEGILATVTGVLLLVVGATTVFAELQDDLDRIWEAPGRAKASGWWAWLRSRLLSMGVILAGAFLLMASLAASALFDALGGAIGGVFGEWKLVVHAVNFVVSFGLTAALFAVIYRFMPSVHIEWHDVIVGAVVTALLFTIGKSLIGLYIGHSAVASGFGAAGSLAVLLVWVYYSAQVFLLGAEFTWAFAHAAGSHRAAPGTAAAPSTQGGPAPAARAPAAAGAGPATTPVAAMAMATASPPAARSPAGPAPARWLPGTRPVAASRQAPRFPMRPARALGVAAAVVVAVVVARGMLAAA